MKLFRAISSLIFVAAICILCGCQEQKKVTVEAPDVTGTFDFTILKSGQADAIIMQTENFNVVIDVGEKDDGDEVAKHLSDLGIEKIDYLFITHFDKDHVGGFPEVMENVTASNIIVPDYVGNNDEYEEYMKTVSEYNLQITTLTADTSFVFDETSFNN